MPKLGFSMEQGTVVQWIKNVGERVDRGQVVVLVHSEKVEYEVEALGSGKLVRILAESGAECPPGNLLGVIAEDGDDIEVFVQEYQPEPVEGQAEQPPLITENAEPLPLSNLETTEVRASPRARKLAAEKNLDIASVAAEVPGKRVTEDDVVHFLERHGTARSDGPRVMARIPLKGLRGEIARRMLTSCQSSAMVALSMPVDFYAAEELHRRFSAVTYQDIVMRAVALELRAKPRLNSEIGRASCRERV